MATIDLTALQTEHRKWVEHNFPGESLEQRTLGVCEEAGELAHAVLKMKQGIRGDTEKHELDAQDALGDLFIFAMGVADELRVDLGTVILETWERVKTRDWQADPLHGGESASG